VIAATPEILNLDLTNTSAAELSKIWCKNLSDKFPEHLPKAIMVRLLAYRIQVEQHGGLSRKTVAYLKSIEADLRNGKSISTPYLDQQKLKSGCQLIREHDGVDHRVTVVDEGFEWQGSTFASLSAVAKAITGTNWNGYRFFGLTTKASHVSESAR
jgi:Protein of unknown function (DUF2924)